MTKWCPFARAPLATAAGEVVNGASVVYRRASGGPDAASLCIASACMAWRRNVAMFDRMTGEPAIPGFAAIGDLEPRYTSRGYCGLAGSPQ